MTNGKKQAQHAPGPYSVEVDNAWEVAIQTPSEHLTIFLETTDPDGYDEMHATARRIAAALAYCEGTDTETLRRAVAQGHTLSESINSFIEEMRSHIGTAAKSVAAAVRSHRAMMEERDALLEALRRLVETHDALANARLKGESWTAEYRDCLEARKAALHLIKEAEAPEIEAPDGR